MYYEALDDAVTLWLRKNRENRENLAKMLGMAPNTLMWKLRGDREFTLSEALQLAEIVGVPLDRLAVRGEYADQKAVG